jgi:hypothetical protein
MNIQLISPATRRGIFRSSLLIPLALTWFALLPTGQAKLPKPRPDGSYPNDTTAEGEDSLFNLTTGARNTALGADALSTNTTGNDNTATGAGALQNNTASANTANGSQALFHNTTGSGNTATGFDALFSNTTGDFNTATGASALFSNTTGTLNTATGLYALLSNTTGGSNTANGLEALLHNTTGFENTANGVDALSSNTTGGSNTANGIYALLFNTTGNNNTADGAGALNSNTTGNNNIALGCLAGWFLGTGDNNIDIGNPGSTGDANTIRIGTEGTQTATFVSGIDTATVAGNAVAIGAGGQLGVLASSRRFKQEIVPMDKASEVILALTPVTFRYKREIDPNAIPQFGLVAEDVEKVNPDLVSRDRQGKAFTVRYEAVNAMLLNEFLKEHKKVEEQGRELQEQKAINSELRSAVAKQEAKLAQQQKDFTAHFKQLDSKIQTVNDKVELGKPAPRTVENNQ